MQKLRLGQIKHIAYSEIDKKPDGLLFELRVYEYKMAENTTVFPDLESIHFRWHIVNVI